MADAVMLRVWDRNEEMFFWCVERSWFYGHDFDTGTSGPFGSYQQAVAHWHRSRSHSPEGE